MNSILALAGVVAVLGVQVSFPSRASTCPYTLPTATGTRVCAEATGAGASGERASAKRITANGTALCVTIPPFVCEHACSLV